jgi:Domain of unknown function (DUF4439)
MSASATPAVRALQAALVAENAAVYGYGAVGAHLTGAMQKAAVRYWVAHQMARDTLAAMVTALGAQPAPAAAAYQLPFPVHDEQAAVMLAALLEDRVATAYLGLVALSDTRLRMFGARALQSAALRATSWRGQSLAFPGLEVPAPGPVPAGSGPSLPSARPSGPGSSSRSPATPGPSAPVSPTAGGGSPPTGPAGG